MFPRFVLPAFGCLCAAASVQALATDVADLSLEELGNLRVTSAALRSERYADTPASIFVITSDDIRRSGVTSLMEALRLAPNLEVARVSGTTYAISARGFQNVITNKLLVLLDGRTLYTTVLSGVLWDAQDVMLEDVERIEVISGPGAALFGANAFTGVINIISKSARDTKGSVVVAGAGKLSREISARTGGAIGEGGAWRIYGTHVERDNLRPASSGVADDMSKDGMGFRADFGAGVDKVQVQGDGYDARIKGNGAADIRLKGGNLLAAWSRELGNDSRFALRTYYDYASRDDPVGFVDRVGTLDVEGQYDMRPLQSHRISIGAGYRRADDRTEPSTQIRFIPQDRMLAWRSAFLQDEVRLRDDFTITLGARAQAGFYGGTEVLPDVRVAWKPSATQLAWISVSKVARVPGRIDRDFFFPANAPFLIQGGPQFQSETGRVYEVGYRATPTPRATVSIAVFRQDLDRLRGGTLAPAGGGFIISNEAEGRTTGIEAWALLQLTEHWRLMAGWLALDQDLRPKAGSIDLAAPAALGNDPNNTVRLRSSWRVSPVLDVDVNWRYVSKLAYLTTVPAYSTTDVRLAWRVREKVEVSLVGSDLFHRGHVEFDEHGLPARIPRAAYAQVRWQF